jgi:predicted transcriptional regulator
MRVEENRSKTIRQFLIENLRAHPADIVRVASEQFACTRQAVHRHLKHLIDQGLVTASGDTRARRYQLAALEGWGRSYELELGIDESTAWQLDIAPRLDSLHHNVRNIWYYGLLRCSTT